MTEQSFHNYIGNLYCCHASLAYDLCGNLEKGLCVTDRQWDYLWLMTSYIEIMEGFDLPHYEDTIRENYDCTVTVSSAAGDTDVRATASELVTNSSVGDTIVLNHKGKNYSSTITGFSYSSGETEVSFTISGDQTSVISDGDNAEIYCYRTNDNTEADEVAKNCLEPDEMEVMSDYLNRICGTRYVPDFKKTTINDSTT